MVVLTARRPESWLTPAAVARATGGRIVRPGRTARRVHTDTRDLRRGDCFVALVGEHHDGHAFVRSALAAGAAGVVVSRPLTGLTLPKDAFVVRVDDTTQALLALAGEHRSRFRPRVVGITGSCGKTSTKDLLGGILAAELPAVLSPRSFNNHVGVPLTLLSIGAEHRAAVVEIGTNAPGEIRSLTDVVRPDIAIVTCVAEAHLQGLGSLGDVAREKASIFAGLAADGVAIVNADDASCREMAAHLTQRVVTVSLRPGADWFASDVAFHGMGTSFRLNGRTPVTLAQIGSHNVYNALLALAAAIEMGVDEARAVAALCGLPPSSRRLQPKRFGGLQVFDDTYNMNPRSARAALAALAGIEARGRRVAVFGAMRELGAESARLHHELGACAAASALDLLVVIGDEAADIAAGAVAAGMSPERVLHKADRTAATELLRDLLRPGDVVLCKASRAVALDRLVDELQHHWTEPPPHLPRPAEERVS